MARKRPHSLTPEQRTLRARLAAHQSWANTTDVDARTAPGRRAAAERFVREVDPHGRLDAILAAAAGRHLTAGERAEVESIRRRVEHARKAHYTRLAFKSAKARRAKRSSAGRPAEVAS